MTTSEPVFVLWNVSKTFNNSQVLANINLQIMEGERVGLCQDWVCVVGY